MQPRRLFQFVSPVKVYTEKSELPGFKFRAWLIQLERRSEYERELLGALNKYLEDAEKVAREAGLFQTPGASRKATLNGLSVARLKRNRLNPDFHFSFGSANHRVDSDASIYAGLKALKALRRSTPNG